jgi:PAS domain S-box-containing protein
MTSGTDELLQSVLSSVREAMCVLSRDGRVLSSNDAWAELDLDLHSEAPLENLCTALIGDSSGAPARGVAAVLEGAQDVYTLEFPRVGSTHERWLRVTVTPLRRRDGGAVVVLTDLTEYKKTQVALQGTERLAREGLAELEHLYQTAPVGLCLMDCELRFVRVNERLAAINGKPVDEHIGRRLGDVIPDVARTIEPIYRQVIESGEPATDLEVRGTTPRWNGTAIVSYYPLKGSDGTVRGVSTVVQDITARKRTEEALKASETAVRDLAGKLIVAQEDERRRVARELHDGLNQELAALSVELGMFRSELAPEHAKLNERLAGLQSFASRLIDDARSLSRELHPSVLEHLGLEAVVSSHCAEFRKQTGIQVNLSVTDLPEEIDREVSLCLYRVAQEALRNAARHADAFEVVLKLAGNGSGIALQIVDDGSGFDVLSASRNGSLGLVSMEERVRFVGGELDVSSKLSVGTRISVRIPPEPKGS